MDCWRRNAAPEDWRKDLTKGDLDFAGQFLKECVKQKGWNEVARKVLLKVLDSASKVDGGSMVDRRRPK